MSRPKSLIEAEGCVSEKSKDVEKRTEEKEGKTKRRKKTEDAMQRNEVCKGEGSRQTPLFHLSSDSGFVEPLDGRK